MKQLPQELRILTVAAVVLVAVVQVGMLRFAFGQLGLGQHAASLLLVGMLLGSFVNLPLFSVRWGGALAFRRREQWLRRFLPLPFARVQSLLPGRTVVAVNVGGCLAPVVLSGYLLLHHPVDPAQALAAVTTVTMVAYLASFPVPRVGIVMPIFLAPLAAAVISLTLDPDHAPVLAYAAGTFGVLLGADLLHLQEVRKLGGPLASIGGAGTFDGIFLTGVIAALLAAAAGGYVG